MVSLLCTQNYIMIKSRIKFPQLLIAFLKEEKKNDIKLRTNDMTL